jgi:hypothetical protein
MLVPVEQLNAARYMPHYQVVFQFLEKLAGHARVLFDIEPGCGHSGDDSTSVQLARIGRVRLQAESLPHLIKAPKTVVREIGPDPLETCVSHSEIILMQEVPLWQSKKFWRLISVRSV